MPDSPRDAVLLVFAKAPEPGTVKTRLAGPTSDLTEPESARLYSAFLQDAIAQYATLADLLATFDVQLHWAGDPAAAEPFTKVDAEIPVVEQSGADLGERMETAFRQAFADGYDQAVVIGTDHPTLPNAFVEEAFVTTREPSSICLGPSMDGGYYLLGMNGLYPEVFDDMTYSHAHVFKNTLRRAAQTDAEVVVLPEFYDVDTPDTLRRMLIDLRDGDAAAPNTRAAASDLRLYPRFDIRPTKKGRPDERDRPA